MSGERIAALCAGVSIFTAVIVAFYAFVARELGVRDTLRCVAITAGAFAVIFVVALLLTYASEGEWFA